MRKSRIIILSVAILVVLAYFFVYPLLFIATGYSAKRVCSCHFLEGRSLENVIANDVGSGPVASTRSDVDEESRVVETTMFGLARQRAQYKENLGCMLIHGEDDYNISLSLDDVEYSDFDPWDLPADSITGYDPVLMQTAVDNAFDPSLEMDSLNTRAVVVIHRGKLVAEKYANHFSQDTPILGWSMTKSLTSAMIGILVRDGKLSLEDKELFAEWTDDRKDISLKNLLNMQSGLEFDENYATLSDATEMLFRSENMVDRAAQMPLEYAPGSHWSYSSGTTNILSGLVRDQFNSEEEYLKFPYQRLFGPLGMKSMVIETDEAGNFVGSSYGFATPRDWAKFGLLYLNQGNWNGEQLLDSSWVEFSHTPAENSGDVYGGQFWLNYNHSNYPDVPADMYFCSGFEGQFVFIIPSEDLVVVRMGLDIANPFNVNQFLKEVIAAVN